MKILIVSDAWKPQVNGVVRTLEATQENLRQMGHEVRIEGPRGKSFFSFPLSHYPEIRLEFFAHRRLNLLMCDFAPDFIHIATEGPLGWAARRLCLRHGRPFTTSYHTNFPAYVAKRLPRFLSRFVNYILYAVLRCFHAPAGAVMVATASVERELAAHRFHRLVRWSRGVDMNFFDPAKKSNEPYRDLPRPILLNVGRVAIEKNLRAFLDLKTQGTQIVIGDGPDRLRLMREYPDAHFLGGLKGEGLARAYAAADLFVFPSKTDTFGLVLLEACASGLRIAAYPVMGPTDIFADETCKNFAVLDENLQAAVDRALGLSDNRQAPQSFAARYGWQACTENFFAHLQAPSPKAERRLARWFRKTGEGI